MQLKIKKLHCDAVTPTYGSAGAACFDISALELVEGTRSTFRTGLAFEVPEGYAMLLYSRSGHGFKNDTRLANCVAVIDSDYRGELLVKLRKDGNDTGEVVVGKGSRIAQAMLVPVEQVQFVEVEELSETARGANGLGSTGT